MRVRRVEVRIAWKAGEEGRESARAQRRPVGRQAREREKGR
jgi:hypothetical protein